MGFGQAISSGFSHYVDWKGRAGRSEFWYWILFTILAAIAAGVVDSLLGLRVFSEQDGFIGIVYSSIGWVASLTSLILFLPTISMEVRRLHDTGRTGWWWWLHLLDPLCGLGTIILIIAFYIQSSQPGDNQYGPPPNTVTV